MLELHQFEIAGDERNAREISWPDDFPHRPARIVVTDCAIQRLALANVELRLVAKHGGKRSLRIEVNRKNPIAFERQKLCHIERRRRLGRPALEIGDDVLIYQNVTLGGTGKEKGKRHPTIGNHVVVGTGAKVLGNIVLGDYVKVGAGSVVVKSVPQYSTVVGVPGRIVRSRTEPDLADTLEHGKLPDPEGQLIEDLARRIDQLEQTIKLLAEDRVPQ